MIKVLMLTTNSSLMDGINRHILSIAPALNRLPEIEVGVCIVHPYGELNDALEKDGVQTFSLNAANGHDWHLVKRYYQIVKSFNPDIIHCHVMALMERIISSICFRHVYYIETIHGIGDNLNNPTLRMRIENILFKIFHIPTNACCYISNGVYYAIKQRFSRIKINEVCYNPIKFIDSINHSHKLHDLIGIANNTPIIGTSCRLSYQKNPKMFTAVICRILKQLPEIHAVILGTGDDNIKIECQNIIKQANVDNRFHWLGYRSDAPTLIRELNCFIMTSHWEGLPTSLLECMVSKTPFAFLEGDGGLKDIAELNEKEGPFAICGTLDNPDKFIDDIIDLLNNGSKAKEYAERAYQVGKRYFDINVIVGKLASLYKKVVLK